MRFLSLALASLLLMACSQAVRYSPAEISGFPQKMQGHIRGKEIVLGMTQLQARYSWGAPAEVRVLKPDAEGRLREEWTYKNLFFRTRLLFTEGKLTEISSNDPKVKTRKAEPEEKAWSR
jgi:outer membrane biogenesis lipoprotein LolB